MRNSPHLSPMEQLRRKLIWKGLPVPYVNRVVGEMSEHWEDLKTEAEGESLSPEEAIRHANQRIGNPAELAKAITSQMRQSTWWGRHPLFSFGLLPILVLIVWWISILALGGWFAGAFAESYDEQLRADWNLLLNLKEWARYSGALIVPLFCCWLARRSYCSYKWSLSACIILAIHNFFHAVQLTPPIDDKAPAILWSYNVTFALSQINLGAAFAFVIPFLVFGVFLILSARDKGTGGNAESKE